VVPKYMKGLMDADNFQKMCCHEPIFKNSLNSVCMPQNTLLCIYVYIPYNKDTNSEVVIQYNWSNIIGPEIIIIFMLHFVSNDTESPNLAY
jgi:hypothetical protein